jgi:tetratricopeptide (TPR) repeat protein
VVSRRVRSAGDRRRPRPRQREALPADGIPRFPATGWPLLALAMAGILAYANSLSNPFVFDDQASIVDNDRIRHVWNLSSVLFPERELAVAGRPLVNVSLAINYALGGSDVVGYHVWNILIHVVCALLLFGIVRRTLQWSHRTTPLAARGTYVAFAAALLWVLHPLNSEAVDYVIQRTESMMALFYLLTLYANLRALTTNRSMRWQVAAVLSCAAGMACKESMVTAPVLIGLFDRVFVFDSWKQVVRTRWRFYASLATTWLILAGLLWSGPRRRSAGFFTDVSVWTYVLNQAQMITRYLRLVVWPWRLVANYGWPLSLTLLEVLPSAVCVVGLLAITIVGLRRRPPLGFLGACCALILAPTSSVVPIATEVGAERRMYLPLAALLVLLVVGVTWVWDRLKDRLPQAARTPKFAAWAAGLLLAAVAATLAVGTAARNREYQSAVVLSETTVERYPTPVAHAVLAEQLLFAGDRQAARAHLRLALPGAPRAHYLLGVELFKDGHLDDAIAELRAFIREQPYLAHVIAAHGYIGKAFALQERWPDAIGEFREMLRITSFNPVAEQSLAEALFHHREFAEAILHYRAYLDTEPNDVDVLNELGIALASTGKTDDAIQAFRRAEATDPRNGPVQRNLASALGITHNVAEAATHARQAVLLQPDDAGSHEILASLLEQQGHLEEATAEFERSLQLDPGGSARDELQRIQRLVRVPHHGNAATKAESAR